MNGVRDDSRDDSIDDDAREATDTVTDRSDVRRVVLIRQADNDEHADAARTFVETLVEAGRRDGVAIDVEERQTAAPDEAIEAARSAVERGVGTVAAVGGDGALNLMLEPVAGSGSAVVSVPAGTVNLVAQTVGLDDPAATASAVIADTSATFDVGENEQGMFLLNASSGYDAAVVDDGHDHSDVWFGRVRFLTAGIRRLRHDRPQPVSVRIDDEPWFDGRAMSVIVLNVGQRASGSFDVAPDAEPDDGLLDVSVVRCDSILRTALVIGRLALGRRVPDRDVVASQGARITVIWNAEVSTQRDGDADALARVIDYRIRPGAVRLHCA